MAEYERKLQIRSSDWNYGGPKWKLSRSKLDLFKECSRCFYLDNRLGVARPRGPSFTLNIAVDALLKKEFDIHRVEKTSHPLMREYGVDAIPFSHEKLNDWRENFIGIQYLHPKSGLTISGAIDDIWVNKAGELIIVDYKSTSKDGKIESLSDSGWDRQYKRQMEVYQWLFRKKGFKVSSVGYFVYVNGKKDRKAFDGKLEFDITLISHIGDDSWVEKSIIDAKQCLDGDVIPLNSPGCEFCMYRKFVEEVQEPFKKKVIERRNVTKSASLKEKNIKISKKNVGENKTTSLF